MSSLKHLKPELLTIRGERCSGTRWLEQLLRDHFPFMEVRVNDDLYRWKHGFWGSHERSSYRPTHLVVTIRKAPESWLLSLHRDPYHMDHRADDFSDFLRSEYYSVCDDRSLRDLYGLALDEELPERRADGSRYPNVVEMYKAKLVSWDLNPLRCKVHHFRYEELLANTAASMAKLARTFQLQLIESTVEPFARRDYYLNKEYLEDWSPTDLRWLHRAMSSSGPPVPSG